jgi:hypothetical protein
VKKLKPQKVDWERIERFLQSAEKKLALGIIESGRNFISVIPAITARKP